MLIAGRIKMQLKKPIGRLYTGPWKPRKTPGLRIISIGDICTLELLARGITPHLAVFDHRFMRKTLSPARIRKLGSRFKRPKRYKNPPGTLSDAILKDAKTLIARGGAVLIDGEEDLTALAFIRAARSSDRVVYGQPHRGMVVVRPGKRIKKRIDGWLSAASD